MRNRAAANSKRRMIGLVGMVVVAASVLGCSRGDSSSPSTTAAPSTTSVSSTTTIAPTTTTSLVEVSSPDWFATPSKNISCAIRADWVRCDIVERDWQAPPKPSTCFFDWGPSVGVEAASKGRFLCVSDTVFRPDVIVDYGTRVRVGAMACDVLTSGVTCRSAAGHGFSLSREAYELF